MGFATGAVVNYILNRRVTFVSEVSHVLALPKFLMVTALGAGLNWLIVGLLVHRARPPLFHRSDRRNRHRPTCGTSGQSSLDLSRMSRPRTNAQTIPIVVNADDFGYFDGVFAGHP